MAECAWCGKQAPGLSGSHTICKRCLRRAYPGPLRQFLQGVWETVVVLLALAAIGVATVTIIKGARLLEVYLIQ